MNFIFKNKKLCAVELEILGGEARKTSGIEKGKQVHSAAFLSAGDSKDNMLSFFLLN